MEGNPASLISGVPQGSVLGPVLFLIYISGIAKNIIASTLVYVDDTKLKQKVKTEENVEMMQIELQKLYIWGKKNKSEFNSTKFQMIRYGRNTEVKENTEYFTGDFEEIIERFCSLRDLGV